MRSSILIPVAAALGLCLSLPSLVSMARAEGRAARPDIIPVSSIKKGMKGYGLTVFEGTQPERFEVEVIDILHNFRPRQEMILVKTNHPRLEVAKIVGGMSGSPIYFNGKMAGAYAYGWTFGMEPVAGVTPIVNMLDDLERPLPKLLRGFPLGVVASGSSDQKRRVTAAGAAPARRYVGDLSEYSVERHAEQIARGLGRGALAARVGEALSASTHSEITPVATPLLLGGMTPEATRVASRLLEPLGLTPIAAGGSGHHNGSHKEAGFIDGGAIGVNLVSGDVDAMGLGTVTRVEGDHLVAFGHPMMGTGVTSLPTTQARILWFMASQMRSFKVGEATYPMGALVNDRQASIVVDQSLQAPTVAVHLNVIGEPGAPFPKWDFSVAHDPFLTPALLGVALGNGLESTAAERRDVSWSMETKLVFQGFDPIVIKDFGSTPTGTPNASQIMQTEAIEAVGLVFNNPYEHARLLEVSATIKLHFDRDVARLRGVQLLTPTVNPGEKARVSVIFEPYAGKLTKKTYSLDIPAEYAGQELKISIRPGHSVDRVVAAPESLSELLSNLEAGTEAPRGLVFSYETGEGTAAYRGVVAENLPPGVLDRIGSTHSSRNPAQFSTVHHVTFETPHFVVGTDSITVKVRDK